MYCPKCGANNNENASFCSKCGFPITKAEDVKVQTNNPGEGYVNNFQNNSINTGYSGSVNTGYNGSANTGYNGSVNTAYSTGVQYAGFWLRFVAYLIDSILIGVLNSIISIIVFVGLNVPAFNSYSSFNSYSGSGIYGSTNFDASSFIKLMLAYGIISLIALIINWLYFAFMESSKHQATLGKIALGLIVTDSKGQKISFARASGRYFGKILSSSLCSIGYIIAAFTQKKQALHDIIADTLVIKK